MPATQDEARRVARRVFDGDLTLGEAWWSEDGSAWHVTTDGRFAGNIELNGDDEWRWTVISDDGDIVERPVDDPAAPKVAMRLRFPNGLGRCMEPGGSER
jgi:hypothetical protein